MSEQKYRKEPKSGLARFGPTATFHDDPPPPDKAFEQIEIYSQEGEPILLLIDWDFSVFNLDPMDSYVAIRDHLLSAEQHPLYLQHKYDNPIGIITVTEEFHSREMLEVQFIARLPKYVDVFEKPFEWVVSPTINGAGKKDLKVMGWSLVPRWTLSAYPSKIKSCIEELEIE